MGKPYRLLPYQKSLMTLLMSCGLLAMSSVFAAPTTTNENIELKLGESTNYYKLAAKETKYFMVRVDSDQFDGTQDLIIKAQASDFYGDPDIFISTKNQKPINKETSDQVCATYGKDICVVNHKKLKSDQEVYIGIKCSSECKFKLKAFFTLEVLLDDGDDMQLDFEAEETKIFKFFIPASSNAKDEQNRVNSVTITATPLLSQQDNIMLTASADKDQSASSSSRKGVPGWRKGQVLRLSEHFQEDWCTDCWITIMVDVYDVGKYSVMAKSNVGITQIMPEKKFDDVAFFGDTHCYKYYVQSAENDLVIRVHQFSGLTSFTINPKKPAESYDSAAFKHVPVAKSNLIITAKDRQKVQLSKGLYYICAVPHMTSTYSILITEPPKNQGFQYLEDGYDENGEIQGNQMITYVYKVPPLEYLGEDIQLRFRLTTTSGDKPAMAAVFCQVQKDYKKCTQNLTEDKVLGSRGSFIKAKTVGKDLSLMIDHDERTCKDVYYGECYYVIAVIGQGQKDSDLTQYTISVTHSQLNYQILREGNLLTDSVNLGDYKYYSFTLLKDENKQSKNVQKVTFRLNTLHGDADIYVSRMHPYPNKIDYEKSSVQSLSNIDEVIFENADNLETTYYIGVYSFQYSTFDLIVKVERKGEKNEIIPQLKEGIPLTGSIHNEKGFDQYQISIKQLEGYEKGIKIQTQPLKGKVEFYVLEGQVASTTKYNWYSKSNSIEISTKDPNFKRDGTYYISVYPRYHIWDKLTDDYYDYMIMYTTADSYLYLSNQVPIETTQSLNSYQHFRHFVSKTNEALSVSLTVFTGNPELFVAIKPENKFPTNKYHEFSSRNQAVVSGSRGKSIVLTSSQLKKANPICNNEFGTSIDAEPCAVFMGIYCETECKYSLKLSYLNDGPQKLVVGVPQHDLVQDNAFKYYYLIVRQSKATQQIYGVLNSLDGNADLYVKFQDNPQDRSPEDWALPSKSDYALKSTEVIKQDLIVIHPNSLMDCFSRYKADDVSDDDKQCAIVFGIYSPSNGISQDTSIATTRYNFVVYSDVIYLASGQTQTSKVDEKEFQYYIFEALCDQCPIVISVSTFGSGDPDLYINFGDTALPTVQNHDMESSTFKSELLKIDLDTKEVKDKFMKSLKGTYIIGVYGRKQTQFTISITQEQNPVATLMSGLSLKVSQKSFESQYFMYYHMQDEKDFKLQLDVTSGQVDIYISTFDMEKEQESNFAEKLPKSKRSALWVKESVKATSRKEDSETLIVNQERNYCSHCYYLIGVNTNDQKADYTILIHSLDATFENAQLLKFGETQKFSVTMNETVRLRFVIDIYQSITFQLKATKGFVKAFISRSEKIEDTVLQIDSLKNYVFDKSNEKFHTGFMYYLICEPLSESEFTILITQESSVVRLSDGVPQRVVMMNTEEINKYLVLYLQDGDQKVDISIKTKVDGFYPILYMKYYEEMDQNLEVGDFPPALSVSNYTLVLQWDRQLNLLQYQHTFTNVKGGKAGLALNLYSGHLKNLKFEEGNPQNVVYITITTSSIVQMVPWTLYKGELKHKNSFMIYQYDVAFISSDYSIIEFAQCRGSAKIDIIDSPKEKGATKLITNLESQVENGRDYYFIPNSIGNFFILVTPQVQENYNDEVESNITDYLIKVTQNNEKSTGRYNYYIQGERQLHWNQPSSWSNKVNLTWSPLFQINKDGKLLKNTEDFNILVTINERVKLNSMCVLREDIQKESGITVYRTQDSNYTISNLVLNRKYYVNVVSRVEAFVPYDPIEIFIKADKGYLTPLNLVIFFALVSIGFVALYVYKKVNQKEVFYREKGPSRQVEYELTSVHSKSNVGEYQRPTELIKEIGGEEETILAMNGVGESRGYGL